jgi:hypothetical protein
LLKPTPPLYERVFDAATGLLALLPVGDDVENHRDPVDLGETLGTTL